MLAPWGTTPYDRVLYYPKAATTVRANGMCGPCYEDFKGRTERQRTLPEVTIRLIEQGRLDEVKTSRRYLGYLLRAHGRHDLLPKLGGPVRELAVDENPCGARRGGDVEKLPCGRRPRSSIYCQLETGHSGGHTGRSPAGRWFSWA